jgi:dTDP-4-dehydrorhamnose reductase
MVTPRRPSVVIPAPLVIPAHAGIQRRRNPQVPPILIFGAEGQVGWELQRSLALHGPIVPLTRAQLDLRDAAALRATIRAAKPRALINAAAYTAVDKAESESDLAFAINAAAPSIMADEARAAGIPLIHYSSDYAYAGTKPSRYVESDPADPQSVYARSKVAGDDAILASGANAVILRTSWVFAARGANFLRTILRLARERDSLRVVADQVGAPTSAELLADVTARVLSNINSRKSDFGTASLELPASAGASPGLVQDAAAAEAGASPGLVQDVVAADSPPGLFHCSAAGETSWHGFASYIVTEARALGAELKLDAANIEAITTAEYPTPATRPGNSRLDCTKLERRFGLELPPWQWHVRRALVELLG